MFKMVSWLLFAIIVVATLLLFSWKIPAIIVVLVLVYVSVRGNTTDPKTKVLFMNIFTGGTREVGPGLVVPWPWERIATVNGVKIHSIQKRALTVKIKVEAQNKQSLTLDFLIDLRIADLVRYLDFSEEDLKESITEHAESFATDISRQCADLDEIYEKVRSNDLEARVLSGFKELMPFSRRTVEAYHGVAVDSVIISDVKLPEDVEKAALEKEVAKKRAEAQLQEMLGVKRMAQLMVAQAKRNGREISLDKAIELVQQQFGKVEKSVEEFGLSPETLATIKEVPGAGLPIWLSAFLNRFSKATSGKRGRGPGNKGRGNGGKP